MLDFNLLNIKYERFLEDLSAILQHSDNLKIFGLVSFLFAVFLFNSYKKLHYVGYAKFKINNKIKRKDVIFFAIINIFLLLILIYLFPINVPFVDDWIYLNSNQYNNNSYKFFLALEGNHSFLFYKILSFLNFTFLRLSQQFYNLFGIFLLGLTALIFLKSGFLEKKSNISQFIFISILFFPKQIINITQSVNLIWLFFLFFTALFVCTANSSKISRLHSLSIFLGPHSIGSGIVLPIYALFRNLLERKKNNYFYFFFSIISLLVIFSLLPKFSDYSVTKSSSIIEEFVTHFSVLNLLGLPVVIANIFAPPHFYFFPFPLILGVIQLVVLFKIELHNLKNFKNVTKFFIENPLIIIGLMSSVLIVLFRNFPEYLSARYSTVSIIFQLGFILWIFKIKNFFVLKKIFVYLYFSYYCISWFLPYEGFFQHLIKYSQSINVESCYAEAFDKHQSLDLCDNYAYKTLFYGGTWFDRLSFGNSIVFLRDNNLSFFYKLSDMPKFSELENEL